MLNADVNHFPQSFRCVDLIVKTSKMKQNLGVADRLIRLFAGMLLSDQAIKQHFEVYPLIAIWVVAISLLVSLAFSFCPIYALLGIHTISRGN